jgi:hypothetical protein
MLQSTLVLIVWIKIMWCLYNVWHMQCEGGGVQPSGGVMLWIIKTTVRIVEEVGVRAWLVGLLVCAWAHSGWSGDYLTLGWGRDRPLWVTPAWRRAEGRKRNCKGLVESKCAHGAVVASPVGEATCSSLIPSLGIGWVLHRGFYLEGTERVCE